MIEARDVVYRYPGQSAAALSGVSLQVQPGEAVGIIGPNGSGKSTLTRLIKGLLLPTEGAVLVNGLDPAVDWLQVRRLVGLVFHNPTSQIVNAVVEQEVAFGPENLGLPTAEIRERVDEALKAVGFQDKKTAECQTLSMADKQRVALAGVVAMHPRYLLLDEPTTWIEPSGRWPLLGSVLQCCSSRRIGLVLVTHSMEETQICDRLYGMLDGRVEVAGSPEEVLGNDEDRERLALERPETLLLAEELRAAGIPLPTGLGVEGIAEVLSAPAHAIVPSLQPQAGGGAGETSDG